MNNLISLPLSFSPSLSLSHHRKLRDNLVKEDKISLAFNISTKYNLGIQNNELDIFYSNFTTRSTSLSLTHTLTLLHSFSYPHSLSLSLLSELTPHSHSHSHTQTLTLFLFPSPLPTEPEPVWAAWGLSFLRSGDFTQARDKFKYCFCKS